MLSIDHEQAVGANLRDILPDDVAKVLLPACEGTSDNPAASLSLRTNSAEGPRDLSVRTAPAGDLTVIMLTDITRLAEVERQSKETQERLRDIAVSSSDWFWECDEHLRLTDMSQAFYDATGFTPEDVIGKTRRELGFKAPNGHASKRRQGLEYSHEPFRDLLSTASTPNGRNIYTLVSGRPVFDEEGTFRGYRGATRDITDTQELKSALQQAESRSRDFAEAVSDWFWETGPDLRFSHVSNRILENTKLDPDGFIRVSLAELRLADDDDTSDWTDHLKLLEAHEPFRGFVFVIEDTDGRDTWCEISGKPHFAADGSFLGYRGVGVVVTDRVQAERAVQQFASIVAASDDAIISSDIDGIILSWNAAAEAIYGIKAKDVIGKHRSIVNPDSAGRLEMDRIHARVLAGETVKVPRLKRRRPDGSEFRISLTFAPVFDKRGRVTCVAGVGRDVSDIVAADEQNIRNAEELRLITDAVPAAISRVGRDLRYTFVNRTVTDWIGRPREELIGQKVSDLLSPQVWARKAPLAARALRGERVDFTDKRTFLDGQVRGVVGSYIPDLAPDGSVRGFYILLLDQTEQMEAQTALTAKKNELDLVANTIPAAIGHLDRDLVFRLVNATAQQWYSTPERPLLGQYYGDAFPPEISARVLPMAQRALAGEHIEFETTRKFEDGVERTVYIEMLPDRRDDGSIDGVVILATDISDIRAKEAELRAKQSQFEMLANSVPAAIGQTDRNLIFTFVNRTAQNWYGKPDVPLRGSQLGAHVAGSAREELAQRAAQALAGEIVQFEVQRQHSDGQNRHLSVTMTPNVGDGGDVEGLYLLATDITALKTREAEISAKQEQLDRMANSVPAAIAQLDRDLVIRFVNDTAQEWYGKAGQSLVGVRYQDMLSPHAVKTAMPMIQRALNGETVTLETDRVMLDGVKRVVKLVYTPNTGSDGNVEGIFILGTDITDLREAERQVREKERQLWHVTGTAPVGIGQVDRDLRLTFINDCGQRWYGGPDNPLMGKMLQEFIPAETYARIEPIIRKAIDGEAAEFETTRTFADGVERTVSMIASPDIRDDGTIAGANFAATDISRLKVAEDRARAGAEQLRLIADAMPGMIAYCDRELRYLFANKTAANYHRMSADELVGKNLLGLLGEDRMNEVKPYIQEVLDGNRVNFPLQNRLDSGELRHLDAYLVPDHDESGWVRGFFVLLMDVTKRKRAEEEVEAKANQLKLIIDAVPAMIAYLDSDRRYRMVNKTYLDWLARNEREIIGRTPEHIWSPTAYAAMKDGIAKVLQGEHVSDDQERLFPDGGRRTISTSLIPHIRADKTVAGWFILGTDVTERAKTEIDLRQLASTDPLTGVSNRRHFMQVGAEELARAKRYRNPFSIIVCDLDHFKKVNDTYGHDAGDEVLISFAALCRETVRGAVDHVGRLGGEEFALLLPETDILGAKRVAERLGERCRETVCHYQGQELTFRCSMGAAQWETKDADLRGIMIRADAALYYSKESGRDRVSLAPMSSEMTAKTDAA